ncbi:MAG: pyruvate kinase [Actinobacteria bacterium]|jgi:pyruvate kinase|nr:MAG: pyruvate kinase [Actinomycetota bacterium]
MPAAGKTKIIATLGPACRDAATLERMIEAGMDVARINASHASHEVIRDEVQALREASARAGREVSIVLDLMGPRIRTGDISGGEACLVDGQDFTLSTRRVEGDANVVSVTYAGLPEALGPGDAVLIDDGAIRLRVLDTGGAEVLCRVETGGCLRSRKGINLPGVRLALPPFTPKDLGDLELGLQLGVDWIALSFTRSPGDIARLRDEITERGSDTPIIAKIEKREAVEDLEAVVGEADGVMVARGDLGVEMPLEEIPLIQKRIIAVAASQGKPVITATQMLQSMIEHPSPTRAEVSDVANAVFEATDAVMLSGETAVGGFPVEAVDTMQRVVNRAETALPYDRLLAERRAWIGGDKVGAICYVACELARSLGATAIVAPTESGFTARQISRFRPRQPILALTPDGKAARRLALFWGVFPRQVGVQGSIEEMFAAAEDVAAEEGLLGPGDTVVVTAGVKERGEEGVPTTNTIHCVTG